MKLVFFLEYPLCISDFHWEKVMGWKNEAQPFPIYIPFGHLSKIFAFGTRVGVTVCHHSGS